MIGAAMGLAAHRPLNVSLSAVAAVLVTALSAPYSPALAAAASDPPAPYTVTIDPGHGGRPDDAHPEKLFDPGVRAVNGMVEKDLTLDIARRVRQRLAKLGVHVVMTRDSDQYVDISPRIRAANAARSDLFISIHLNYFGDDPAVGGSLVLYPNARSERFARTMSATLAKTLATVGIPGNGIQLRDNLWTTAQMPAITIECAYLSNPGEAAMLKKSSTKDAIAGAIVKGLQAQDPGMTTRAAEIAAYQKAHQVRATAPSSSPDRHGNPLMPWAPVAVVLAMAVVFRRQLLPALAMLIAIAGLAGGRFRPDEPEWRTRAGIRRRRSRARIWGIS